MLVNVRSVVHVVGLFLLAYAGTMLIPVAVGFLMGEDMVGGHFATLEGFLVATAVTLAISLLLMRMGTRAGPDFFRRDGILSVAIVWYAAVFCSALPFVASGALGLPDAIFESASGLTTTGASVFGASTTPKISSLPPSLLFWRAETHWIGGLGIVVMFLVLLPVLGTTQKRLYVAEVPGISKDALRPRLTRATLALIWIYVALTTVIALGFMFCGMNLFEAVAHSFATIATGGFSTRDLSLGEYHSLSIEIVAIFGMLLSGTNFGLYYKAAETMRGRQSPHGELSLMGRLKRVFAGFWDDHEYRLYVTIWFCVSLGVAITLVSHAPVIPDPAGESHNYAQFGDSFRAASFSVASLSTSTGFGTRDFNGWPFMAHALLILVMLHGGCTGSTSGGLKVARFLVMLKLVGRGFQRFLRPRVVERPLQLGSGIVLDPEQLDDVVTFTAAWVVTLLAGGLIVLFLAEVDELTAFTSVLTCMGNIGPGITEVIPHTLTPANDAGVSIGPYGSYGTFPALCKVFLSVVMVVGRLEVYTAIAVFVPSFWRE